MINKIMTADEAVAGVKDGMTIMVGGFLATGSPEVLMDALVPMTVDSTQDNLRENSAQRLQEALASCWSTTW